MARQKKIYKIKVNEELKALGFPTKIIGSQNITTTINKFIEKYKGEILKLNEPDYIIDNENNIYRNMNDLPDDAQVMETISKIDIIKNRIKGKRFDLDTFDFVMEKPFTPGKDIIPMSKYMRAVRGTLRKNDWIGYVHSAHRDNNSVVSKSIIKSILRSAIRYDYVFSFFDVFAEGRSDKKAFLQEVFLNMAKHKVYDSIIELMSDEPDNGNYTDYNEKRSEIVDKVKLLIDEVDQSDENKAATEYLSLKIYEKDQLFSLNRTRKDKAIYVDKNTYRLHHLSLDLKEAKIKERLENESKEVTRGKGINDVRKQIIRGYFKENPKASNRKAAKYLGYDPRTISKYKLKPDIAKPDIVKSDAKSAPKTTIYNTNIVKKGAENAPLKSTLFVKKKAKFNSAGIRIRSAENFKKRFMEQRRIELNESKFQNDISYYRDMSNQVLVHSDKTFLYSL